MQYSGTNGVPVTQWDKRWPTYLAVVKASTAIAHSFSFSSAHRPVMSEAVDTERKQAVQRYCKSLSFGG